MSASFGFSTKRRTYTRVGAEARGSLPGAATHLARQVSSQITRGVDKASGALSALLANSRIAPANRVRGCPVLVF